MSPRIVSSTLLAAAAVFTAASCSLPSGPVPIACQDDAGCPADAHCHQATCTADAPPRAVISGPRTGAAGAATTFDGSSSTDGDDDIVGWTWSVRVLSASCGPDLGPSSGGTFQPAFGCPGEFEVILVVRDRTGLVSEPAVVPVTITAS